MIVLSGKYCEQARDDGLNIFRAIVPVVCAHVHDYHDRGWGRMTKVLLPHHQAPARL